jgi:hypothetical protein
MFQNSIILIYHFFEAESERMQKMKVLTVPEQSVCSIFRRAMVFYFFLSNSKLGQVEIWLASQQGYHLPPQQISEEPRSTFKSFDENMIFLCTT